MKSRAFRPCEGGQSEHCELASYGAEVPPRVESRGERNGSNGYPDLSQVTTQDPPFGCPPYRAATDRLP